MRAVLERFLPSPAVVAFALNPPAPVAVASPVKRSTTGLPFGLTPSLGLALERVNESVGQSIPAVRRALHVIAGTVATFQLAGWTDTGQRLAPTDPRTAWLRQPDPAKTLFTTLMGTMSDGIWRDVSVWQVLDRYATGLPAKVRRLQPDRVQLTRDTYDPDLVTSATVDGAPFRNLRDLILIDWAGIGGLRRWGFDLLNLYADLQAAAGRYAKAPHPKAILHNHGADLEDDEIDALLAAWEAQRETRSVGYLNDVVEYQTFGWNAQELQLTEAREYAALEVARLFGLPARALDAPTGDSMTYANVVDARQDILEALRPWMTPVEATLSMNDRRAIPQGAVLPAGISARFDVDAYVRDAPAVRMATWQTALASGVLTVPEVRALEPLASSTDPLEATQ